MEQSKRDGDPEKRETTMEVGLDDLEEQKKSASYVPPAPPTPMSSSGGAEVPVSSNGEPQSVKSADVKSVASNSGETSLEGLLSELDGEIQGLLEEAPASEPPPVSGDAPASQPQPPRYETKPAPPPLRTSAPVVKPPTGQRPGAPKTAPIPTLGTPAAPAKPPSVPPPPRMAPPPQAAPPRRREDDDSLRITNQRGNRPSAPPPAPSKGPDVAAVQAPNDPFAAETRALVKSAEAELATTTDPLRAARLHFEIARLYESPLRDLRRAVAHYQESHNRAPEHVPTIRGLRRVLISRKGYQAALPLFDAEARITSDPRRKAMLFFAKGRLLEDVLGMRTEARQAYAIALDLSRGDPSTLKALEQVDQQAEAWDQLGRTYEREANAVATDSRHRAALIVQRARLLERRFAEVDVATELYETALRLAPDVHAAVSSLKRLHHAQRRFRDLIRVLELEAQQTSDPTVRTMALYRIGRLHAERLGNQNEALHALERAARESPRDPLVLDELARLYETAERWDSLAEVLQRLVEASREPNERIGLMHRIGQICEDKLGDDDAAVRWYEAALSINGTYLPGLQALGKLYTRRKDWPALIRMHVAESDATDDPNRRAAAHARIAEIFEVYLEQPEDAAEHHAKALSQVPGHAPSFKALARLLADAGRWRELIELYERAVDQSHERDRQITYLNKIGAVYEDSLGEPKLAAHAYRRILAIDADNLGAIHALQRATEQAGRYTELVEALELEAEKTKDTAHIVALVHRAGEVLDDKLGDRDAALVRFRKVLSLDAKYVPALVSLGRLYYRAGRWEDLLDMYKRELELTPRGPASVALLQKMGELCEERIGRDEEALSYYRRAIDIDPTYRPALRALATLLRERGDYGELVKVLELELSGLTDPNARARVGFRVGEVYEERLGQNDRALSAYEAALKSMPDYRPAVDAVVRLRADRKAWSRLVDDFARESTTTPDPQLVVTALINEGEIWGEELGEPRRAIACFERVLERKPGHIGALLGLEPLYRRIGSWDALARVYAMEAQVLTDIGARVAALRELARLQDTRHIGAPDDVLVTLETILQLVPDDPSALEMLERLALERNDRRLLAYVDTRLAAAAEDPIIAAAYQTRLAESFEAGNDPNALEAYRAALRSDPDSLGATRGLSRIAERTNDPEALAEAARREASVARDGEVASKLLVRGALVRTSRLGDTKGAVADLERAIEVHPDSAEAADLLCKMLLAGKQDARLADLLAKAAASAKIPERVASLWMETARIQADLLSNVAGAISALNRVLRTAPNHVPTLRRLADLYGRDAQWNEAVSLLSRVVQLAPDREVLRDAHLALASIWDERLGETARATVSLQAVLALDSGNREALARLVDLLEREKKLDQAADTAARLVEASQDARDRGMALARLARVELKRGNGAAAVKTLREAVAMEGPSSEAAMECKRLTSTPRDWEKYAEALQRYIERTEGTGGDVVAAYLELSRVRHDKLASPPAAIEVLQYGLNATKEAPPIRIELATRLRSAGRQPETIAELQRLLDWDLTRLDTWRDMAWTFDEMMRPAEARLAMIPLIVLGGAKEAEIEYLSRMPPRPAQARPGSLTADLLRRLGPHSKGERAAAALLASLGAGLPKLYTPDLDAYGLSTRDRVTTRHGHPIRLLADRISRIFGVEEFDLYVHRARSRGIGVELSSPPSLLVPAAVGDLPEPQQVYLLARPLANIAQRVHAIDKLTPREIEVLLASAARSVSPQYGSGLTSEEFLDDQLKKIQRALPRRDRKLMEEVAHRYVATPKVDFPRWVDGLNQAARRIASVVADDLDGCIDVMRRTERDLAGLDGMSLARTSDTVADLLRFWISDTALELRKHAGMIAGEAKPIGTP